MRKMKRLPPHTLPKIAPCSLVLIKHDTSGRRLSAPPSEGNTFQCKQEEGSKLAEPSFTVCVRGGWLWTCGPLSEPAGKGQVPAILPQAWTPPYLGLSLFLSTNSCDGPRS